MSEFIQISWKKNCNAQIISSALSAYNLQKEFCDVTISCCGSIFPAHRVILSMFSNYLREHFRQTPCNCNRPSIILLDVNEEDLKALLDFIYVGKVCLKSERKEPFLKMVEKLKIRDFRSCTELQAYPRTDYPPIPSEFCVLTEKRTVPEPQYNESYEVPESHNILESNEVLESHKILESTEEIPSRMSKRKREDSLSPSKIFKPNPQRGIEETFEYSNDLDVTEDIKEIEFTQDFIAESTFINKNSQNITKCSPKIPEYMKTEENFGTLDPDDNFFYFKDDYPNNHSESSSYQEPDSCVIQLQAPENEWEEGQTCDDVESGSVNRNSKILRRNGETMNQEYGKVNLNEKNVYDFMITEEESFQNKAQKSSIADEVLTDLQNKAQMNSLKSHKKKHYQKNLKCKYCHFQTKNAEKLLEHQKTHTDTITYKCDHCRFTTNRNEKLQNHEWKYHPKSTHHNCIGNSSQPRKSGRHPQKRALSTNMKNLPEMLCCRYCFFETQAGREELLKHEKNHTEIITYKCEKCKFTTHRNEKLVNHESKYHPKPNEKLVNHESKYHPKPDDDDSSQPKKVVIDDNSLQPKKVFKKMCNVNELNMSSLKIRKCALYRTKGGKYLLMKGTNGIQNNRNTRSTSLNTPSTSFAKDTTDSLQNIDHIPSRGCPLPTTSSDLNYIIYKESPIKNLRKDVPPHHTISSVVSEEAFEEVAELTSCADTSFSEIDLNSHHTTFE